MATDMPNGEAPSAAAKPTLYRTASAYASQAYRAGAKALQPAAESLAGYSKDAYSWARQGGTWRMILLASAAGVLACVLGGVLALVAVTVALGSSLLFFSALLGLGALAAFLAALCSLATVIFVGSILAVAAVIGAVASAAVCCVLLASVWVLGAWAAFAALQLALKTASSLMQKKKVGLDPPQHSFNGDATSWSGVPGKAA